MPRKIRFFLLFLILFFSASVLNAESFKVAVAGENDEYVTLFKTVLSSFKSIGSSSVLSLREERRTRENMVSRSKAVTTASKNETTSTEKEDTLTPYEILTLEIVTPDLSRYSSFLSSGDADAYDYVRTGESIDGIFYIASTPDTDADFITVYFNGEVIHSAWYNTMLERSEEDILYSLLSALLLGDEWNLYTLSLSPEDASISVDGSGYTGDGYLILQNGTHVFSVSAYGYRESIFSLSLRGDEKEIALSLVPTEPFTLSITTYPFDCDVYFNGIKTDGKIIAGASVPYLVTLSHPRFSFFSYQERRENNHITLEMAPLWTDSEDLITEKKGAFYSSLFYVLLSFGGYSASNAVSNYYSEELGEFSKVVFTGCSIVSLVNLMQSAVDYYNAARMGL